jgi:AAA+ ATPase superfamily predicted ATPase
VDLSRAANPYDFAHPVPDAKQFVGRRTELEDIKYYLDQCKVTAHPISLALLGPRASGKTSVLNVVEAEAKARGYLPVRIDLNEGDVQSDFSFFFKFFDAIVMAVFLSGAFGGTGGKTYDTYLDMIYADQIPEDKTFSPFLCLSSTQKQRAVPLRFGPCPTVVLSTI